MWKIATRVIGPKISEHFLPSCKGRIYEQINRLTIGAAHGWGDKKVLIPKICYTYPAMMKLGIVTLYLKKIQRIYELRGTHPEFC